MQHIPAADHPLEFIGGALALDFTNTIGGTHRAPNHEHLQEYQDLVDFALLGGGILPADARRLKAEAVRHPLRAKDILRRATVLREAMWRFFEALSQGRAAQSADLTLINQEIGRALRHARLFEQGGRFIWGWEDDPALERPLWPIARSAAELLANPDALAQLRECASETCEWLFLDRSRNHTRRWCDMNDCGGRAKVRRFRAKRARTAAGS